jgi:hypothetical protein
LRGVQLVGGVCLRGCLRGVGLLCVVAQDCSCA